MSLMKQVLGLLSIVLSLLAAVAMVCMMLHITADAALRNLFDISAPGTIEFASYYYMVAVTFLPLAYIQAVRGHVIIEIFTGNLSSRTIHIIDGTVALFVAFAAGYFCFAVTWKAIAMTRAGEFVIGTILVVTWPTRWFVVAGTGLLSLVALLQSIGEFCCAFDERSETEIAEQEAKHQKRLSTIFGLIPEGHK